MSITEDLWPEDIVAPEMERTPVGILRDQALALGKRTNNIVEGEVLTRLDYKEPHTRSSSEQDEPVLIHSFYIKAPALDNYRYELLRVNQEFADLYPLTVRFFAKRSGERDVHINDRVDFLQQIKAILGAEETKRVINSLLQQSLATQGVDYAKV